MKLGLFLPLAGDPVRLRDTLVIAAPAAESAGFHSLWFAEHVALFDKPASRYPYSADAFKMPSTPAWFCPGLTARMSDATPVTCGAAIDVPSR